jgi:hypothetical protein
MPKYLQLHIQLRHTAVWRQVTIPAQGTFAALHNSIQEAFGWENSHLYEFRQDRETFAASPYHESFDGSPMPNAESVKLGRYLKKSTDQCEYEYDFGDSWIHDIKVEEIPVLPADGPWLLDGEGTAPPEDCGGIPGYERLLEVFRTGKDPWGEDPEELIAWAGDWKPDSFDRGKSPP